jgi:uncharacterized repeat protein (TIGR01451 family)
MMSLVSRHFFRITIPLLIYTLVSLSAFGAVALAQAPASFEIRVAPQAEYAVAGQPFTYTVVITNVSQTPVKDVIVFTETPTGTTLIETHQNINWLFGGVQPGEAGLVVWNHEEPIESTQAVTIELVVNVLPEMVNQVLVSKEYAIVIGDSDDVISVGLPVTIQVLATIPTATPSPIPTATSTPTTTSTATSSPTSTPVSTSTPQRGATAANTSIFVETSPAGRASPLTYPILIIFGLLVLGGGGIGLLWFFKRK